VGNGAAKSVLRKKERKKERKKDKLKCVRIPMIVMKAVWSGSLPYTTSDSEKLPFKMETTVK
jgi:hypothetical protein